MHDHTKGGVDVVDLLSTSHSTRIKSKRWPFNAFTIGKDLVLPAIQRRYANSNGLQISGVNKMHGALGIKEALLSLYLMLTLKTKLKITIKRNYSIYNKLQYIKW